VRVEGCRHTWTGKESSYSNVVKLVVEPIDIIYPKMCITPIRECIESCDKILEYMEALMVSEIKIKLENTIKRG
jgi:hypothetical protein